MLKRIIVALSLMLLPGLLMASGGHAKLDHVKIDLGDKPSLQRGAKLFVNYCLSCHSAAYMRYNRMGADLGISDKQIEEYMGFITDKEGKFKVGALMKSNLSEDAAKSAFNTIPPDLSLTARSRGPEWIYTYLRSFYQDEKAVSGWNNVVFPSVAMPHVLAGLQGTQRAVMHSDGKSIEKLEMAKAGTMEKKDFDSAMRDLTNFMVYLAEPAKLVRYEIGVYVILFLLVMFVPAYLLNKEYWKDVH